MIKAGLVVLALVVPLMVIEGTAAAKGGAIALPPAEVDVGATVPIGGGAAVGTATDLLVGFHWASLAWHPTTFDIGVGYVGSFRALRPGYRGATAERTSGAGTIDERLRLNGMYLALGRTLINHPHYRAWIELRGELLHARTDSQSFSALGAAARIALEVYASGAKACGDHSGIMAVAGTIALGIYVEASHRDLALDLGPTGVTTGISVRIPFFLVAAS